MNGTGGFINPEKILEQIGIKEGMTIADFGCGHGYFTLPVGKLAGKDGKIFAVDVLTEALEAVRSRAQLEHITNISTCRGNLETAGDSKIKDQTIDIVLLHNVLFQSQQKPAIIKESFRVLKNSGELVLIDWLPVDQIAGASSFGPQNGQRILAEEAKKIAQGEGFVFERSLDAGQYHFGLIFKKP